jgi:predicted nucleotidyltransferase
MSGLFGSFVRGEETKESDIDILVEFEDPTFRNFMNSPSSWRISLAGGLTC